MVPDTPSRAAMLVGTLVLTGLTGWAVTTGQSPSVLAFLGTATVVAAVGASEVVSDVAPWYYVFQSVVLGLFGVGLVLQGIATPLVVGLTAVFGVTGLFFAVRYSRSRRTAPPPEERAP